MRSLTPRPRPEVSAFAAMMEETLRVHDPKLGDSWKTDDKTTILSALIYAFDSLMRASKNKKLEKLSEQCIDVANFAMMLAWHQLHFGATAYDGLTLRQSGTLDFIKAYIGVHGVSPTYREIRDAIGIGNLSTVQDHIDALINRGAIEITHRKGRSIKLLDRDAPKPILKKWLKSATK